ncbi:MAG: DUF4198 domain-containing protein [Pseudomonadota bacterium]
MASVIAVFLLSAVPAFAHVGFLLPHAFRVEPGQTTGAIASFSDHFPAPEIALKSASFAIEQADGDLLEWDKITPHHTVTVLETAIKSPGIYRLSSGERLGRKGKVALIDGKWQIAGRDGVAIEDLPPATTIAASQTATVSDTYIVAGDTPYPQELMTGERLRLKAVASAEGLGIDRSIVVQVLFDDKPLVGAKVELIAPFTMETDAPAKVITDENGQAAFTPLRRGPHVLLVRHIADAPPDAQTWVRSYSTTLTFPVE